MNVVKLLKELAFFKEEDRDNLLMVLAENLRLRLKILTERALCVAITKLLEKPDSLARA